MDCFENSPILLVRKFSVGSIYGSVVRTWFNMTAHPYMRRELRWIKAASHTLISSERRPSTFWASRVGTYEYGSSDGLTFPMNTSTARAFNGRALGRWISISSLKCEFTKTIWDSCFDILSASTNFYSVIWGSNSECPRPQFPWALSFVIGICWWEGKARRTCNWKSLAVSAVGELQAQWKRKCKNGLHFWRLMKTGESTGILNHSDANCDPWQLASRSSFSPGLRQPQPRLKWLVEWADYCKCPFISPAACAKPRRQPFVRFGAPGRLQKKLLWQ